MPQPASGHVRELEARVESLLEEVDRLREDIEPLARFRAMIDGADEAIFLVDSLTTRFVDANQTALRWFGITRDRLTSLSIGDVGAEFPLEYPRAVGDRVNDTRDNPRPLICGRVHRRKDGTAFPVEVAVALRHFKDRTYTLVVARESRRRRDDQKATGQQYQTLFRLTRDAVCVCDRDWRITDVNGPMADLLGYRRGELVKLTVQDLLVGESDLEMFEVRGEKGDLGQTARVRLRKKDGALLAGEMTLSALGPDAGERARFQCLVRAEKADTEEKRHPQRRVDRDKAGRWLLHYSLVVVCVGLAIFSWTDAVAVAYPYPVGEAVWVWGLRLLSLVLVALSLGHRRWRLVARVASVGLGTIVLALLVVYANYMRGMPYELTSAVQGADVQIRHATLAASEFSLACLLVFGWVAWRLWVGDSEARTSDILQ